MKRWREIRDDINATMTIPDLEAIPSMPAWAACEALYVEAAVATGQAREAALRHASGVMDGLRARIESRKVMLQDQVEGR